MGHRATIQKMRSIAHSVLHFCVRIMNVCSPVRQRRLKRAQRKCSFSNVSGIWVASIASAASLRIHVLRQYGVRKDTSKYVPSFHDPQEAADPVCTDL